MSLALAAGSFYVALVWHQHQPLYPKRPGENVYTQPWVRLHATKDYIRIAQIAARHPEIKVTINLTPSLLAQLADLSAGATDRAMVLSSIDARILNAAQKREIHRTFFSAGRELMRPLPRYAALARVPAARFTAQDWRDLQVYFNLAWLAPEVQREKAIAALIRKGRDYTENDKLRVLRRHHQLVREVIPTHVRLEKAGKLEVTTTPYAHPILPLLVDSDVASQSLPPGTALPPRFRYPQDAEEHVRMAIATYKRHFGHAPRGMWPAEGAVSQAVMPVLRKAGVAWIATDEQILARTLGTRLRQDGALARPELLTGLWKAQDGPAIVFRDHDLSDRIGFVYGSWDGRKAARDLVERIRAIGRRLPAGKPALLGIALDGENAWEYYPGNGETFLAEFHAALARDKTLHVTTPGEVFARHAPAALGRPLAAGSWVDGTFSTWIGEPDENAAWELLGGARAAVERYAALRGRTRSYAAAMDAIRAAEGSDWFWWYGKDQDSGHDADFDKAFRDYLAAAYRAIGQEVPEAVLRPAGAAIPAPAWRPISPPVDGRGGATWQGAIAARRPGGAMQRSAQVFDGVQVGADRQHLYLAADFADKPASTAVVLGFPGRPGGVPRRGLSFPVQVVVDLQRHASGSAQILGDPPGSRPVRSAWGPARLEAAVPWSMLGARGGEDLAVSFLELGATPYPDLPVHIKVPPLPDRAVVAFADPAGDAPPAGDVVRFAIEEDGPDWIFVWTLAALPKAAGTLLGLGAARLEAYVSTEPGKPDPAGVGLLPGRTARATSPWRLAVVADGARPGYFSPPGAGLPAKARMLVDPGKNTVSVAVPKRAVPGNPRLWNVLAGTLGVGGEFSDLVGLPLPAGTASVDYVSPEP